MFFLLLFQLKGLEVLVPVEVLHEPGHTSPLSLLFVAALDLLILALPLVLLNQPRHFFLSERPAALSEVLDDGGPLDLLALDLALHSVEHLLEGLPRQTGVAFGVSGDGTRDGPQLGVLTRGEEEVDGVDRILAGHLALGVVDVSKELQLLLGNVNLVSRSEFWQLL